MAQNYLAKITDSDDYFRRKEQLAVFARLEGLHAESDIVAKELITENRACRLRWLRIMQGG